MGTLPRPGGPRWPGPAKPVHAGGGVTGLLLILALASGGDPIVVDRTTQERLLRLARTGEVPLDPTNRWSGDARAADLGRWLFHEPRLSRDASVSCATCHRVDHGFAEPRSVAHGLGPGTRHTQSVLDAAHQRWLTWDGRADSLWSQALHPFQSEREMGLSPAEVIERIRGIEPLRSRHEALFGPLPERGSGWRSLGWARRSVPSSGAWSRGRPPSTDGWSVSERATPRRPRTSARTPSVAPSCSPDAPTASVVTPALCFPTASST
ncbi:MAG: hypothetical protein EBQ99_01175 [Planctomycetes bacterium]|nr:hypothetical protein [Planctomycetota bacterium]